METWRGNALFLQALNMGRQRARVSNCFHVNTPRPRGGWQSQEMDRDRDLVTHHLIKPCLKSVTLDFSYMSHNSASVRLTWVFCPFQLIARIDKGTFRNGSVYDDSNIP